jgi:hypothetical protein
MSLRLILPILLVLLVADTRYIAFASPTPARATNSNSTDIHIDTFSSRPPLCNDLYRCRALFSIVWSCLTTVFLCTWVAMHPDVPDGNETDWFYRLWTSRIHGLAVMLIAPEWFVIKASDDWASACGLIKRMSCSSGSRCFQVSWPI